MTISELAERADVTPRTIRYYVEQGLLPTPGRGRVAEYTDEHLQLLALIARLKRRYLPLDEIRDILQRLDESQVEELLEQGETQPGSHSALSSAGDYIAAVLGQGRVKREAMLREPSPPAIYSSPPPSMPLPAPSMAPPPEPRANRGFKTREAAEPDVPFASDQAHSHSEASIWHRVTLAPGVELHFDASRGQGVQRLVPRLVKAVGDILGINPEKEEEER